MSVNNINAGQQNILNLQINARAIVIEWDTLNGLSVPCV